MLAILDLDPVWEPSGAVSAVSSFGDQASGRTRKPCGRVRPNLALLDIGDEDAFGTPRQEPGKVVLAKVQRERPKILSLQSQRVERIELHLIVMSAGMQAVEV